MNHVNEVQRQIILYLRASFPQFGTVALTTDVDFSADGAVVQEQPLPIMYLTGPRIERSGLFTSQVPPQKILPPLSPGGPDRYRRFSVEDACHLYYQVVLLSRLQGELAELWPFVQAFFINGKTVSAHADPDDLASPMLEYEIDLIEKFQSGRMVNLSNLKEMSAQLIIRGVLFSDGDIHHEGSICRVINLDGENLVP